MFIIGTLVNAISVLIGGIVGTIIGDRIREKIKKAVMEGIGLCIAVMGLSYALKANSMMVVIVSIVVGSIIGEIIDIDKYLNGLGTFLEKKFSQKEGFAKGFIASTLLFCVGSMAILGALQSGLRNDHQTLYVKSILDGISSIMFASTFGAGVCLSAGAIFIYQGSIALLAKWISPYITGNAMKDLTAVGGILILALAFDMLKIKKFKVSNMLPSVIIPVIYYLIVNNLFIGLLK